MKHILLIVVAFLTLAGCDSIPSDSTTCPPEKRSQTSGYYLLSTLCNQTDRTDPEQMRQLTLMEDVYVKTWSYAVLNKSAFWAALALSISVLIWPSLAPIWRDRLKAKLEAEGPETDRSVFWLRLGTSSGMQTTLTALAAFSIAFYAHYKTNQSQGETLLRQVFHAETVDAEFVHSVIAELERIDAGFSFSLPK